MSMKVGILMGGPSDERKVSLATGSAVFDACVSLGYAATAISFNKNYKAHLKTMKQQDIIFNALHGGIGENGKIQSWMEKNNIKYTGSGPTASALCMDKAKSKKIALKSGIKTPKWEIICKNNENIALETPFVVKPNDQGSTFGLSIVHQKKDTQSALEKAFSFGRIVIIEEYVKGRELTVPIIDNNSYPILEIKPANEIYDYKCKYTPGMCEYVCPAELDSSVEEILQKSTEHLFRNLGCQVYARADYILDENGTVNFLEMNTLPGMTATSLVPKSAIANNLSFKRLIDKIISLSI